MWRVSPQCWASFYGGCLCDWSRAAFCQQRGKITLSSLLPPTLANPRKVAEFLKVVSGGQRAESCLGAQEVAGPPLDLLGGDPAAEGGVTGIYPTSPCSLLERNSV